MQRAYPWLTALFLLGCLALGWRILHQRAAIEQASFRRGEAERLDRDQAAGLQDRLTRARDARVAAEKMIPRPDRAAVDLNGLSRLPKTIRISDIVREHPEFAALWSAQARRKMMLRYGAGLAELNLPPERLEKLKRFLMERELSYDDATQAAEAAGLEVGSPGWKDATNQATGAVEQEITNLLGTDGAKVVRHLQNLTGIQNDIQGTYGPDFDDAGASLSPDQAQALAQALDDSSYIGKNGTTGPPGYNEADPASGLSAHDNRILSAAAPALTSAQLQILRTELIQEHQQAAIQQQYSSRGVMIVP